MIFELCDLIKEKITKSTTKCWTRWSKSQRLTLSNLRSKLQRQKSILHIHLWPRRHSPSDAKSTRSRWLWKRSQTVHSLRQSHQAASTLRWTSKPSKIWPSTTLLKKKISTEENKDEFLEDQESEEFTYDTALYCEALVYEDVDFDWKHSQILIRSI